MSQNNTIQGYAWENQSEDNRDVAKLAVDEILGVYKVYVKDDLDNQEEKSDASNDSSGPIDCQFINGNMLDLDGAINADVVTLDGNATKMQKIKEADVPYSQTLNKASSSTGTHMVDKDDPRSRLHFVKYLKRNGTTTKVWECGICSKEFRHQYTLMRHLPTHTDERNFKCDVCGKAFRQLSTLSQHKAIHSDARPYICEFCQKTFNRVSTLISHRKTHSENKPHKCNVCGKGFHQKGNLRNHVFTHTNERPYKCDFCGKGFNQMSNLVCHKVKAHAHVEKMQYSCSICSEDFPRRFALRSHEESKHGIKYRTQTPSTSSSTSNSKAKQKKNLKIIELQNDNFMDIDEKENVLPTSMQSFVIDKIETEAMEKAIINNQEPFALFKPANGIPVLVKIEPAGQTQHLLTPATAEDLQIGEKINADLSEDNKGVQLKVPVVATVNEILDENGKSSFIIEPPNNDENEGENLLTPLHAEFFMQDSLDESERISHSSIDDCNELLELAAQGGIQFVRATDDGRYEVMSNSEARELMAQNSHDVTILEGAEADAINVDGPSGTNNNVDNIENGMMLLDAGSGSGKYQPKRNDSETDDIKNIRNLDSKSSDECFTGNGGVSFQGSKIDDFIISGRPTNSSMDIGLSLPTEDDCFVSNHQEFSNIVGHSSDFMPSIQPLLTKNDSSIYLLNENVPYLKNLRNFSDDFSSLLNGDENNDLDDNSVGMYDTRIKLSDLDDLMSDHNLMAMNQDLRLLERCQAPMAMPLPNFSDMKILGPKYQEFEAASSYHDIKIFNSYDQCLRNNSYRPFDSVDTSITTNKEMKMIDELIKEECLVKTESQASGLSDFLNFERSDSPGSQKRSFILDGLPDLD
ncbi:hypothetical protein HCN44_009820 [Aphidius gifuensis]|uniref:C2H2-type domain-containing protein n=1 Tax=Aphidius gifuensis TaxID=684658 RepID=A0A834Y839_APHGI|nr:hypothetical protein HCN44_009820 [Aphidius gifuensis]